MESLDGRSPRVAARRAARTLAVVFVALAPSGCMALVAGAAGGAAVGASVAGPDERRTVQAGSDVGASVAVSLAPARDVAAVGRVPDDTTWVRDAIVLLGRVTAVRGDTLRIALSEGRGSGGTASFPSPLAPTVELVRGEGVAVRVLSRAPAQTDAAAMGMLVGALTATAAVVAVLMLICSSQRCMD